MGAGVLGHLGHHAVKSVVVEARPEEDRAIIHHQEMAGLVAMVRVMTHRDVIPKVVQVNNKPYEDMIAQMIVAKNQVNIT